MALTLDQLEVLDVSHNMIETIPDGIDRLVKLRVLNLTGKKIYSYFKKKCSTFIILGVRSLANASQARQFNPLNPPGVGWVKLIIFLR